MVHCINTDRSLEVLSLYLGVCTCGMREARVCHGLYMDSRDGIRQRGWPGKHLYMLTHLSSPPLILTTQIIRMPGGAVFQLSSLVYRVTDFRTGKAMGPETHKQENTFIEGTKSD